jgi:hypothetical protein
MHPFKTKRYHLPAHLTESVTFRLPNGSKNLLLGYSREKNSTLSKTILKALAEYKPLKEFYTE